MTPGNTIYTLLITFIAFTLCTVLILYLINHPGGFLNFHHFKQVRYIYFATNNKLMVITKRGDVTKQGFCKIL